MFSFLKKPKPTSKLNSDVVYSKIPTIPISQEQLEQQKRDALVKKLMDARIAEAVSANIIFM